MYFTRAICIRSSSSELVYGAINPEWEYLERMNPSTRILEQVSFDRGCHRTLLTL